MPDKNILIDETGNPNELIAPISRGKRVSFFPTDSDHTITVRFTNEFPPFVPFTDWATRSKTGRKGRPLTGRVDRNMVGDAPEFLYRAKSSPGGKGAVTAQPKLIVDGGRVHKGKKKKAAAKKTARKK